jgi:hypothetical protein
MTSTPPARLLSDNTSPTLGSLEAARQDYCAVSACSESNAGLLTRTFLSWGVPAASSPIPLADPNAVKDTDCSESQGGYHLAVQCLRICWQLPCVLLTSVTKGATRKSYLANTRRLRAAADGQISS